MNDPMNDAADDVVLVNCTVTDARAGGVRGAVPGSRTAKVPASGGADVPPEAGAAGGEGRIADAAVWIRGDRIAAVGPRERILERAHQEEALVRERADGVARQFTAYVASFRTLLERHLGEVDGLQRRVRPEAAPSNDQTIPVKSR